MNHHETILLAEQHRAELIADAASIRHGRTRTAAGRPARRWFGRRRGHG
jgi:hypothetical protein